MLRLSLIRALKSKRNPKQKTKAHPLGIIVNRAHDEAASHRVAPRRAVATVASSYPPGVERGASRPPVPNFYYFCTARVLFIITNGLAFPIP